MIFKKSTFNLILASIFALLLSACAQQAAKIDAQIHKFAISTFGVSMVVTIWKIVYILTIVM